MGCCLKESSLWQQRNYFSHMSKANKIKKNPQGHFLKSKVLRGPVRVSLRKSNWRGVVLDMRPFYYYWGRIVKNTFPTECVCVCSLYSTLSNLLLRKGKFIGLEPNPRKRKTQEKRENFRSPLDARHFCCSCSAPLNCLDRHKVDAYIFYFSLVFQEI